MQEGITGAALELLLAVRGLKEGDEVVLNELPYGARAKGEAQDATLINGRWLRVDRALNGTSVVKHPNYSEYFVCNSVVIAWRPGQK